MIMLNDTPAGNPAEVPMYEARTLYQIPIDLVREDPDQPRKSFDPQTVFDMMDKASTKIQSINASAWTDDDKANFQTALTSLKTEIDNCLNQRPPAAPAPM